MTEAELRGRVCDLARAWEGLNEYDGSHRAIIDTYNQIAPLPRGYRMRYSDPWCAAFVSALAQTLGLCAWIFPECGCGPMVDLYRAAGRWMERDDYLPDPADVIFYDWEDSGVGDCTGAPDHVGVVIQVDGETITVMEGNCGNAVKPRRIRRNSVNIRGFGLPDYAAAALVLSADEPPVIEEPDPAPGVVVVPEDDVSGPDTEPPTLPEGWAYVPLPILRQGDESEAVRALQILLRGRGYRCGWTGADGEFGPRTAKSLKDYQMDRQLPCKPEAGPEVWEKLICD